jgi:hypothetical protein
LYAILGEARDANKCIISEYIPRLEKGRFVRHGYLLEPCRMNSPLTQQEQVANVQQIESRCDQLNQGQLLG